MDQGRDQGIPVAFGWCISPEPYSGASSDSDRFDDAGPKRRKAKQTGKPKMPSKSTGSITEQMSAPSRPRQPTILLLVFSSSPSTVGNCVDAMSPVACCVEASMPLSSRFACLGLSATHQNVLLPALAASSTVGSSCPAGRVTSAIRRLLLLTSNHRGSWEIFKRTLVWRHGCSGLAL